MKDSDSWEMKNKGGGLYYSTALSKPPGDGTENENPGGVQQTPSVEEKVLSTCEDQGC